MKTTKLLLQFPHGRSHEVEVTFTDAACVVVHPTVYWYADKEQPEFVENDWTISQYPTGLRLFDGVPTQSGAIECANKFLNIKHFVGMSITEFYKDFRASNMSKQEIEEGEKAIVAAYQYIHSLRSRTTL